MDIVSLKFIGAGLTALGMLGAAIGAGNVFASLINSIARNPGEADRMTRMAWIGASFSEAMGLLSFVLAMLLLFSK